MTARTHYLEVPRTARYVTLGGEGSSISELWFAVHGIAQLAPNFARRFQGIASDSRLIVVPEALSRYYVEHPGVRAGEARVGASWMTREERETEIQDHVRYLDLLWEEVHRAYRLTGARVRVLGFSQGVATVSRWLARSRVAHADQLILWAGRIPADIFPLADDASLRRARWTLVVGDADEFATPDVLAEEDAKLRATGVRFDALTYVGGHAVDPATLAIVADAGASAAP